MKAVLLGPHPQNGSYSTTYYFNFYSSRLPALLPGWDVGGGCPGGPEAAGRGGNIAARTRWENFVAWPVQLRNIRADLWHVMDQGLAWYSTFLKKGRRLITVHDLIAYMTVKGLLNLSAIPHRRRLLVSECIRNIRSADHIVSVSECTAAGLVSLLGIPARKITVVSNVLESDFSSLSADQRIVARAKWFPDADYAVIHVGKSSSYKNRIGALRAFDKLHKTLPGARMFLVHGNPDQEEARFLNESSSRGAVQFLPNLTRPDLREFYGAADVLIFPSLYEGFGWPPLEAMACGCPVVCTTRGSLGEVVGDAALTVQDPHDHASLANALRMILLEDSLVRDLRSRGLDRVKMFAPTKLLGQMAEVYRLTCRDA